MLFLVRYSIHTLLACWIHWWTFTKTQKVNHHSVPDPLYSCIVIPAPLIDPRITSNPIHLGPIAFHVCDDRKSPAGTPCTNQKTLYKATDHSCCESYTLWMHCGTLRKGRKTLMLPWSAIYTCVLSLVAHQDRTCMLEAGAKAWVPVMRF